MPASTGARIHSPAMSAAASHGDANVRGDGPGGTAAASMLRACQAGRARTTQRGYTRCEQAGAGIIKPIMRPTRSGPGVPPPRP